MAGRFRKISIGAITIIMLALGSFTASASAEDDSRVLTVAFPEAEGINEVYEDGSYGGIVYDWLVEIAKYTGWEYRFVTGDPSVLLSEMMAEKYDLMGGMFRQEALQDYFCYPSYSMGSNYSLLLYRKDDESIRNFDITTLNGKSIGVLRRATSKIDRLEKFLSINDLTCTLTYYDEVEAYEDCLKNRETDIMLGSDIYLDDSCNVAASFSADPFYLVTAKDEPELCRELDEAMTQIYAADPNFATELYEKYFSSKYINSINFSDADLKFMKESPPVRVAVTENNFPFYAVKNNVPQGIVVDMLALISQRTGLSFEYVTGEDGEALIQMVHEGEADIIGAVLDDERNAAGHRLALTKQYASMDEVVLRNKQSAYPAEGLKVALLKERKVPGGIKEEDVLYFSTFEKCLDAVNSGRADLTRMPSACLEGLYAQKDYPNVALMAVDHIDTALSFALPKPLDGALYSVLNKTVNNIRAEEIDSVLTRNLIAVGERHITLRSLLYANPLAVIGVCLIFFILVMVIILLVNRFKMKSRIMALKLEKAEETARVKTDFLSRMSHEIRTPMNAIIGLTNLALLSEDTPAPTREKLEKIDTSAEFLLHLINDVLDMTKIGSSKMTLARSSFDMEKLIAELENMFAFQTAEKEICFTVKCDVQDSVLAGDEMRLKQIMVNLLSNACKFTGRRGNIVLSVSELSHTAETATLRFSVKDDGEGIRREDMERIFHSFEQSEAGVRSAESTGLGLPISRSLVELMGGKLEVESTPGEGTEFSFILELGIGSEAVLAESLLTGEKTREEHSFAGLHFLLAEDNDLNAEIAASLLEMEGACVERAEDGEKAVQMFTARPSGYYAIVLMDLKMPVMDGLTAAAGIRSLAREDAKTVPIVAMTANTFAEDRESAREAGMNGFISKPFDLAKLCGVLEQYLE